MLRYIMPVIALSLTVAPNLAYGGNIQLQQLLASDENAYVVAIEEQLIAAQLRAAPASGLLTRTVINEIGEFCRTAGIEQICRRGILTQETAEALEGAFNIAPSGVGTEAVLMPVTDSFVDVHLRCNALGEFPSFERELTASSDGEGFSVSQGVAGAEGYEVWTSEVLDNGEISISGSYIEGGPAEKAIAFEAKRTGAIVEGSGTRGPRECTFTTQ